MRGVPGVTDPSFANVCVGDKVGAKGDVTDTTVTATVAFVLPKYDGDMHRGDSSNKPDSVRRTKSTSGVPEHHGVKVRGNRGHDHKSHDHSG